jgi:hypothetical protein
MPGAPDQTSLNLLVIAQDGSDAGALLRSTYRDVRQQVLEDQLDETAVAAIVDCHWAGQCSATPLRIVWRVRIAFDDIDTDGDAADPSFASALIDAILDLPRQQDSPVAAIVKLTDPVQTQDHMALYRELYDLEMILREVVSYIFASEYPENLIDGLLKSGVRPASLEKLPSDQLLIKQGENQFFYILFNKYAVLNDLPEMKVEHLYQALAGAGNLDEVRSALDLRPIKEERHVYFIASLSTLMNSLERVRNAVAHHRTVPKKSREDFYVAARRLREEIEAFWQREAEHIGTYVPPTDPPAGS